MIIDKRSSVPIYQQIVNQHKALIACGVIAVGEQLESVRSLSSSLGINPNTIQKAYTELESLNICSSAPGKGRFVTADAKQIIKSRAKADTLGFDREIYHLVLSGLDKKDIAELLDASYEKAGNKIKAIRLK